MGVVVKIVIHAAGSAVVNLHRRIMVQVRVEVVVEIVIHIGVAVVPQAEQQHDRLDDENEG